MGLATCCTCSGQHLVALKGKEKNIGFQFQTIKCC